MSARILLFRLDSALPERQAEYSTRTTCLLGKDPDCGIRFPVDEVHRTISRHHCLLDINPPDIRVRDLGSRNGTFVNDVLIGKREKHESAAEGVKRTFPEHDLKHGDVVRLGAKGKVAFRVEIDVSDGLEASVKTVGKYCLRCGRDVSTEVSENRQGEFICGECKANPEGVAKKLLELAQSGKKELVAIKGYRIIKELGRGGMGAVYLAEHEKTGNRVALKIMLPGVPLNQRSKEGFLREIETTKFLKHPNVVQLLDLGCSEGTFFFTMEYCDGGSVDRLMKERGETLSIGQAGSIVLQALTGLEYAHRASVVVTLPNGQRQEARGLVHRDLKPQNVFLSGSGTNAVVKVGDYGLAKAFDMAGLSGYTFTGDTAGTPVFMPRQQVVDFRFAKPEVDVWAVAASFYYLVTGQFPRNFPTGKDPWQIILQTDAVPIRQRDRSIPKKLAEVIDTALVDKPEIQFKTASALKKALEEVL